MVVDRSLEICRSFGFEGALNVSPFGSGHINDTYLVVADGRQGVLQRINANVFPRPDLVMDNIARVCRHLEHKGVQGLEVLPTLTGAVCHVDDNGDHWRMYRRVCDVTSFDRIREPSQAYHVGRAFGAFQGHLADLGEPRLHDTIAHFHHTPRRYERLTQVAQMDPCGRRAHCQAELEFLAERASSLDRLTSLHEQGLLPERITHNDTKLNNLLFCPEGKTALCVVDLDTVMPGLVHYDFGDMVRTATNLGEEDDEPERIGACLETFRELTRGYLESGRHFLTPLEVENLAFSGLLLTLEVAIRFLTDHLEGDVYFKIHAPEHNLRRARAQIALAASLERQLPEMEAIVAGLQ